MEAEEGVKLVDFLSDKVLEYVSTPNGTNLNYRYAYVRTGRTTRFRVSCCADNVVDYDDAT